jgi:hypothetical protein
MGRLSIRRVMKEYGGTGATLTEKNQVLGEISVPNTVCRPQNILTVQGPNLELSEDQAPM